MSNRIENPALAWKIHERILFRIAFIYLVLQAVPLDWKYYRNIFSINWSDLHYRDLFYIARYTPQITEAGNTLTWGTNNLADWGILFALAVIGAAIWSGFDSKKQEYNYLYYVLRVILRYRLAIAVIAYGFIKLFPLQQPYPSLSLLNTNYGDLSDWKIAALSYGVAPSFESFLGGIEVLAGLLLLNRKSASIGAAIVIGFTGNVFLSNLAYGGGETIYCLYLLVFATVIFFYDAYRFYSVIVLAQPTKPNRFNPLDFFKKFRIPRRALKGAFIFLFTTYAYLAYSLYKEAPYHYPVTKALKNSAGLYNVSRFEINGRLIPYSLTDSLRWQNVVFENWATVSIQTNRKVKPEFFNTEEIFTESRHRDFESTESIGRKFYSYEGDTINKLLQLTNKNSHYKGEQLTLKYKWLSDSTISLSGRNEKGDSLNVVLDKIKKTYVLTESYLIPQYRSVFD